MTAYELAKAQQAYSPPTLEEIIKQQADRIAELEFENKAFRKELFNIGSMRSCSYAAQHHGFVSPRQAGDDAREYIAEILEKAKVETK